MEYYKVKIGNEYGYFKLDKNNNVHIYVKDEKKWKRLSMMGPLNPVAAGWVPMTKKEIFLAAL